MNAPRQLQRIAVLVSVGRHPVSGVARALCTCWISAAMVCCASPTTVRFARFAIGALPSMFTAIT